MFGSGSFILRGSSDRNARLWTPEAKFVRNFGREKRWNLKKPSVYAHSKNPWSHIQGERKDNKKKRASATLPVFEGEHLFSTSEPLKSTDQEAVEQADHGSSSEGTKDSKVEAKERQTQEPQLPRIDHPQRASPSQAASEDMVQNRLTTPQLSSILSQRNHESLFKHNLEEGLLRRIARRTVRRRVFGEINPQKVNQFGTACSPFHALATTAQGSFISFERLGYGIDERKHNGNEIENLTFPSNLPMTARMMSKGIVCTTESDLKSMQLTFPELDGESVEESMASDRKKALDQAKKSKLPPLIKLSRSQLSENKKTSGCRLPSVPTIIASASLKWGKY